MSYSLVIAHGTDAGVRRAYGALGLVSDEEAKALLEQTLAETKAEFPDFKIVPKGDSALMKAIDVALRIVSLNQIDGFMDGYYTTIGNTIYAIPSWFAPGRERGKIALIRHERQHMRQRRALGPIWYTWLYLLPLFPLGLARGRAALEREAYEQTILTRAELYGIEAVKKPESKEIYVRHFTTASYGWMWPFRSQVEAWYDESVKKAEAMSGVGDAGVSPLMAAAIGGAVGLGLVTLYGGLR